MSSIARKLWNFRLTRAVARRIPLILQRTCHIDAGLAKQVLHKNNYAHPERMTNIPDSLLQRAVEFGYVAWPRDIHEYIADRDVLDIGCGTGLHAIGYVIAGVSSYTGLDPKISPENSRGKNLYIHKFEEFGWSARQLMEYMPNVNLICGTFENVPIDRTFDVLVLHNVTEHLLQPEDVFKGMLPLLRPDGIIVYNHHNFFCWNGHHQAPKTINDINKTPPDQRRYLDWAHLDYADTRDDKLSHRLNKIRVNDLRILTERYFKILEWKLIPSKPYQGSKRLTPEIMQRYPKYQKAEFLTQHVFCVAQHR